MRDEWTIIDAAHDGGPPKDVAAALLESAGAAGVSARLRYADRAYRLDIRLECGVSDLIEVVVAELAMAEGDGPPERVAVRLLTPVRSLTRMDPWGRIRVRRGLRGLLAHAAAAAGSAVS